VILVVLSSESRTPERAAHAPVLSVTQLRHCQGRPSLTAFGAPISLIRTSIHDPWRKIYHKSQIVPWTEVTLRRHQPTRSDEVDTLDTLRPNSETPANPTCIRKWGEVPIPGAGLDASATLLCRRQRAFHHLHLPAVCSLQTSAAARPRT
jgi:hypothetical protein